MNEELKLLMIKITEGDKLPLRDIPIGSCFLWADQGKAVRIVERDEPNRYLLLSNIFSNGDEELIELSHVSGFEKEYPVISEAQLAEGLRINKENPPEPYIHPVLAGLNTAVGEYFRVMGEGIGDMPLPQPRNHSFETEAKKDFFKFELLGKHAYCSIRHVHSGHNAKIGAYLIVGEAMYIRLDFTIVNPMSAWCALEDVVLG